MESTPLISIIVPMYNAERYIKRCIDSIISQTYKNIEILLINDGSKDNTYTICNEFCDERIRFFSQENRGVSAARNLGLHYARGEYICFVDADDIVLPDYVKYMYELISSDNADISICNFVRVSESQSYLYGKDNTVSSGAQKVLVYSRESACIDLLYKKNITGYVVVKLFKRSVIDSVLFNEELKIAEDFVFLYKVFLKAGKIIYGDKIQYLYISNPASCMHEKDYIKYENTWNYMKSIQDEFNNSEKIRNAFQNYIFISGLSFYAHSSGWNIEAKSFKRDILNVCHKLSKRVQNNKEGKNIHKILAMFCNYMPHIICELLRIVVLIQTRLGIEIKRPI